jgi:branched-chain amino acid transport system ATP-binding protein
MAVIETRGLYAGYNGTAVVRDLDLKVERGQIVALLGPNGAGKTTTVMTLAGVLAPIKGTISTNGRPVRGALSRRARQGLGLLTEQRSVFMRLKVSENLRLGLGSQSRALEYFPELESLLSRRAGLLSGGEQQMLALARTLAAEPSLLLVDELSLGLAPKIVQRLLEALVMSARRGVAILLVEQHTTQALTVADHGYVMRRGSVVLSGSAAELRRSIATVKEAYLSAGSATAPAESQPRAHADNPEQRP